MRVLIVEDERRLAQTLADLMEAHNYGADIAYDGEEGLDNALSGIYDVILLDVMLPKRSGYEIVHALRKEGDKTPVLMLTARTEVEDRINGLDSGADYYLTKPFDARELLACVGALLRRQGAEVNALSFGNTTLDLASGTLICGQRQLRLSAREFDVMRYLLQTKGQNVSKEAILSKVWGFDSNAVENHVEVYVGFLRKKLAAIGSNVRIEAVRRLGYHLEVGEVC